MKYITNDIQEAKRLLEQAIGAGTVSNIGKTLKVSYPAINQTGANVTYRPYIPFDFRLKSIWVHHTDSTKSDSSDALTMSISIPHYDMDVTIYSIASGTSIDYIQIWEHPIEQDAGQLNVVTNTTNTDKIYIVLFLEAIL